MKLSLLFAIMHKQLDSWEILHFGVLQIDKEIEVVPDVMVLFLVLLETVLFSIEQFYIHPTYIAFSLLICISLLGLLSNLCEFVDDDGSKYLLHDDFDDEEIDKIEENLQKRIVQEIHQDWIWVIIVPNNSRVSFQGDIQTKRQAAVQCGATGREFRVVVEIDEYH